MSETAVGTFGKQMAVKKVEYLCRETLRFDASRACLECELQAGHVGRHRAIVRTVASSGVTVCEVSW